MDVIKVKNVPVNALILTINNLKYASSALSERIQFSSRTELQGRNTELQESNTIMKEMLLSLSKMTYTAS